MAQLNRGRVSDPAQAALSGSQNEAPGSAGGHLTGYFFEGVMTKGMPTIQAMEAVQSNIVGAGYAGHALLISGVGH